jgi:PTS system N-acetylglucosamine-specific IIB component
VKDLRRILDGLGGVANIRQVEPCITRLRAEVVDPALVDRRVLRDAGCHGVVVNGRVVQVVVGPEVDALLSELEESTWVVDGRH